MIKKDLKKSLWSIIGVNTVDTVRIKSQRSIKLSYEIPTPTLLWALQALSGLCDPAVVPRCCDRGRGATTSRVVGAGCDQGTWVPETKPSWCSASPSGAAFLSAVHHQSTTIPWKTQFNVFLEFDNAICLSEELISMPGLSYMNELCI